MKRFQIWRRFLLLLLGRIAIRPNNKSPQQLAPTIKKNRPTKKPPFYKDGFQIICVNLFILFSIQ
jgi:hypothetical protein